MENRKSVKYLIVLGALLAPFFNIQAYDAKTTHPALTQEIIKYFEYSFPDNKLSNDDKEIIEKGSIKEDSPVYRCLNHFYDPVYEKGLKGLISAKNWAQNTELQALLSLEYAYKLAKNNSLKLYESNTDYSFNRAVFEYVYGDKERALETLGHILHLLEDMTVPAHTRDDAHVIKSPFEDFAKQFTKEKVNIANELILDKDKKVYIYDNLNAYFYNLALFSNTNFFSADTILIDKYYKPNIDYESKQFLSDNKVHIFGYSNNPPIKILEIYKERNIKTGQTRETLSTEDYDNLIFIDYWNVLSKQAVLYGAGVIKLFFDEVENERETLALLEKNTKGSQEIINKIKDIPSNIAGFFYGIYAQLNKSVAEIDRRYLIANMEGGVKNDEGQNSFENNNKNLNNASNLNSKPKPEDPNSPELQRLALILREAERMIKRTEKEMVNLEGQNVGGSLENLVLDDNFGLFYNFTEMKEYGDEGEKENSEEIAQGKSIAGLFVGYGGGGGGGAVTSDSPSEQTVNQNLTATSTPTLTLASSSSSSSGQVQSQTASSTQNIIISPPQITNPIDFSQTFASTTITFTGIASSTQTISTDFSSSTTIVLNDDTWELNLNNFNTGTTTINFYTNDDLGNISLANTKDIFINVVNSSDSLNSGNSNNLVNPDVNLEIFQCNNSMSDSSCLISELVLDIDWATTLENSDFSHFNIENNGVFSETQETGIQITGLSDNQEYSFSVATISNTGESSATSTQNVIIKENPVIINEIAWMGTDASSSDEWVELYNRSDVDINLDSWFLYTDDNSPNINFSESEDKVIEAGSYYLIERTDDNAVSDIGADMITSFGVGLNNNGENIYFGYKKPGQATTTIDQVDFSESKGGWIERDEYRTQERYNPNFSGSNRDNWDLTIDEESLWNGLDKDGEKIKGTPKERNSISYRIISDQNGGGILSNNLHLTKENSPYIIDEFGFIVEEGSTLIIDAGVIIKFVNKYNNSEFVVNGTIEVNGTETEPVVFTSITDDEYGGDTNNDGICDMNNLSETACPGINNNIWTQVILSEKSKDSYFNYTIFRYGGSRLNTSRLVSMVVAQDTDVDFNNCIFEKSYSSGFYLDTTNSNINSCIFRNNKNQLPFNDNNATFVDKYYGLMVFGGDVSVENSDFNNNQVGLGVYDTENIIIKNNIFNDNNSNEKSFPLILNGSSAFDLVGNNGSENDKNGISIEGYITKDGINTNLNKNSLPYVLEKSIYVVENSSLNIGAGSIFKFKDNNYLNIMGELNVNGEENNKVIFTSVYDDSDGVDVYGDDITAISNIAKKGGINLHSTSSINIENTEFRYLYRDLAFLNCNPVELNLKNVLFQDSTWSIYADNQNADVIFAENLTFATTSPMSMNDAVKNALQNAKDAGANIIW